MASNVADLAAEGDDPQIVRPSNRSRMSMRTEEFILPGIASTEASAQHITTANRSFILVGVLLVAWACNLDNMMRSAYHNTAMNELNAQALVATIYVVKSVISAATQPAAAKVSDVFGRVEVFLTAIVLYVSGSAIEAFANNAAILVVGGCVQQLGWVITMLILEVVIADSTSLRSRLLFSYVPILPSLCNMWYGGEVLRQMRKVDSWRFGFWVWCIVFPVAALPLALTLLWVRRKAKKAGTLEIYKTPVQVHGAWGVVKGLFWQLDFIGMILGICVFGFILVPLTMSNSFFPSWKEAKIIAPLATGVLCIPIWIYWEGIAPHPMIPFSLLKDRAVWGPFALAFWMMFAWACQGNFMLTILIVVFEQSQESAIQIAQIFSFTSTLTGIFVGMVVYRVRRLKRFVVIGTFLFMIAFGILIYYYKGATSGFIAAQVILGVAGGFIPYAAQVSIQAAASQDNMAVITGLYLSMYNVGFGFGNAVSGIVYSHILPEKLKARLPEAIATQWFTAPLRLVSIYPPGTPYRDDAVGAFAFYQRVVSIIGVCACVGLIVFSICLRDPRLPTTRSVPSWILQTTERDNNEQASAGGDDDEQASTVSDDDDQFSIVSSISSGGLPLRPIPRPVIDHL